MLTKPIAQMFWKKICPANKEWFNQNITLLAKMALMVYRKEGKQEAETFIYLVRLSQCINV